jgi:hypothetical protein
MAAGIVGITGGAVMLASALILATAHILDFRCAGSGNSNGMPCDQHTPEVVGLSLGGVAALALGIPLLVYGAKKVPVGTPAWAGAPGGPGWRWRL